MNKTYPKRLMYLMIFSIFISQGVKSQDLTNEFKIWYGINVNTKINKNFKLKFGAMLAENTNPSSFSFAQGKLGLSYKIKKHLC